MHRLFVALMLMLWGSLAATTDAGAMIHSAPVIIKGQEIRPITRYPLPMYRVFRTDPASGKAVIIPFQIDEINEWGDYVLPEGGSVTAKTGSGMFDVQDELSFMGDDVGPAKSPTDWSTYGKPSVVFEIRLSFKGKQTAGDSVGAVYVGIYFQNVPKLSERSYVSFDRPKAEVLTSRYRYSFDQKNWLVSRRVDMLRKGPQPDSPPDFVPLLASSTFYMRADLKYFLTVEANHRSIDSLLEAYKTGPIRSIIRISFHYTFLKLNFELGMYTEVSFFSNAVYLPTVLYNPLDGKKNLNTGSGFYYGMALIDNPRDIKLESNMPPYKKSGILDFFASQKAESLYWISASAPDRMLYMEISPSDLMRKRGAVPMLYSEPVVGSAVVDRNVGQPAELGQGPVNMALYFDMTKFNEGEHAMAFRLFFENVNDERRLQAFKSLGDWVITATRMTQ